MTQIFTMDTPHKTLKDNTSFFYFHPLLYGIIIALSALHHYIEMRECFLFIHSSNRYHSVIDEE